MPETGITKESGEKAGDHRGGGIEVVLWTRRPVCGPRTTVIDRLGELRTRGVLANFRVETWPEEVVVGEADGHEVLDRFEAFEAWADEHGLSVRPPFETRTASLLVGSSREVLVTPMVVAAVHEDGDLVGVYPCTDGDRTWTVEAFLDVLSDGGPLPHRTGDRPVPED